MLARCHIHRPHKQKYQQHPVLAMPSGVRVSHCSQSSRVIIRFSWTALQLGQNTTNYLLVCSCSVCTGAHGPVWDLPLCVHYRFHTTCACISTIVVFSPYWSVVWGLTLLICIMLVLYCNRASIDGSQGVNKASSVRAPLSPVYLCPSAYTSWL